MTTGVKTTENELRLAVVEVVKAYSVIFSLVQSFLISEYLPCSVLCCLN